MQAAPTRYVSVSELYSTDEVELLLDEIRELEPTSCRGEDVQDFEIAGSGCSGGGGAGGGGAGGRSPAGTSLTERSWDSHAHYRRPPPPHPRPLAPLYCRLRYLASLQLLLVVVCCCACGCVWGAVGLRAALLPRAARVQLLLLAALSSLLLHAALLTAHVTGLAALLPIDWNKLAGVTSLWSALSLLLGGALTLHGVALSGDYRWAPAPLYGLLLAAAALGLLGAALAAVAAVRRLPRPRCSPRSASGRSARSGPARAEYRAVPAAPRASTSRDDPL